MGVRHYNLDEVMCSVFGIPITEYEIGDAIVIEYREDDWKDKQGHNGSVIRSLMPNTISDITLVTMQGSPINELLQSKADEDRRTGLAAGPFFCKDLNGTSIATASRAWIKKRPGLKFSTEPGSVEWMVVGADTEAKQGTSRLA
jgi:hypothetical protein